MSHLEAVNRFLASRNRSPSGKGREADERYEQSTRIGSVLVPFPTDQVNRNNVPVDLPLPDFTADDCPAWCLNPSLFVTLADLNRTLAELVPPKKVPEINRNNVTIDKDRIMSLLEQADDPRPEQGP